MRRHIQVGILAALVAAMCTAAAAEGVRLSVGSGQDTMTLLIVEGTPYEMGRAFGNLMKDECNALLTRFLDVARAYGERCSDQTLDAAWESIKPHTDPRFVEELRGLADGAGIPLQTVIRGHMIPVVSDYSCSGVAMWGEATANGHLYQIRNLDYTVAGGLQDHPAIVVYRPTEGIPHVNVTFAGYIGCNTGINAEGIALTEKGESPSKDYPFDLNGVHFSTLYRTILYDARSLDDALDIVKQARRIKKYYFYIGDGQHKRAAKLKLSSPDMRIWFDNDPADELHPNVLENCIYHTMKNDVAFAQLSEGYGKHDHMSFIRLSKSCASENGNLLNVVYDATGLEMWVAYAEGAEHASARPYVHVDLNEYLNYDLTAAAQEDADVTVTETPPGKSPVALFVILGILVVVVAGLVIWRRRR